MLQPVEVMGLTFVAHLVVDIDNVRLSKILKDDKIGR